MAGVLMMASTGNIRGKTVHAYVLPVHMRMALDSASDSVDLRSPLPLPVSRPLSQPPAVGDVGALTGEDGAAAAMALTASLAYRDLRMYERQLKTLFPMSAEYYPLDSIRRVQVERASAWLIRLQHAGSGVTGRQRVALAMVAFRAEQDSMARRVIDARLAETRSVPVERSLALITAVALFADRDQSPARLARNFPVAEAYANQLRALPASGYTTRSDSLTVRRRQALATQTLLLAAERLPTSAALFAYVERFFSLLPSLTYDQRYDLVRWTFPYRAVARGLMRQSDGRARVDSLNARLLKLTTRRSDEWPADRLVAERPRIQAREQQDVRDNFASFDLIGHPAPPIAAHAWLNTPDSAYAPTPRVHSFNDGIIRVISIDRRTADNLPALDRIQRHFSTGVQVLLVTQTEGHGGPDLMSPREEVAWIKRFLDEDRHVAIPVALWAGAKAGQEMPLAPTVVTTASTPGSARGRRDSTSIGVVTDTVKVAYQRYLPVRSPVPATYRLATLRGECVIVDGQGRIAAYHTIESRRDEAEVIQLLADMLAAKTP